MTSFGPPCRTEPVEPLPDRLVAALYMLLRDHVHPGDLEQVTMNLAEAAPKWRNTTYSNPHLEALARAYASFLLADQRTYPYQDGDTLVIGPECFVSLGSSTEDNPVISYRGRNFVVQSALGPMRTQGWKDAIEHLRAEAGNEYQDGWAAAIAELERVAESSNDSSPKDEILSIPAEDRPEDEIIHIVGGGTVRVPMSEVMRPGGLPPSNAAREQAARAELAELELQQARERIEEAARRPDGDARTPPMIVYSSEEPPNALAAFIAQELEHWGFTIESLTTRLPDDPPHTRFRVVAGDVKLTVEVEAY